MSYMMQPPIILLKDGTDTSQGIGQMISNINACEGVADVIRSTLGPRGMDKLIHDGQRATISNDGAQILSLLDIVHPAAKVMVDIAESQDAQIGDGTTTVTILAAEFMKSAKEFVEDGMHPMIIIKGYRLACDFVTKKIAKLSISMDDAASGGKRKLLERCAMTSLNSKLISRHREMFGKMIVDAVTSLDESMDLDLVGIKKVQGGSVTESMLVKGVAFKKTFSYAGFEQMAKSFDEPKILCLNVELELKSEKDNAEIRIDDPDKYQSIVDAEWRIIYEKLEKCVAIGANIILSRLPIGDLATQYFADRGLFCAGRVADMDLRKVNRATGSKTQTSVHGFTDAILGRCGKFREEQVGNERFNFFTECPKAQTATIILRGGSEQFIEESHRSIHDAICVVKRSIQSRSIVAGGGAIEAELAKHVKELAMGIEGKMQNVVLAFGESLEIIPRQLADNAGFDSTDILNKLRQKHTQDPVNGKWFGVDVDNEGICNTFTKFVWEPASSKINSINSAVEAATLILSVDETVRNPQSETDKQSAQMGRSKQFGRGPMMGGGQAMSGAMGGKGLMGMAQAMGARGIRTRRGRGGK